MKKSIYLILGGHNYCRNPEGEYQDKQPWCYTNDDHVTREICAIRQCSVFNMWLYIAVPAVSALAILGLSIGLCCMKRKPPPGKPLIAPAGTNGRGFSTGTLGQGGVASNTGTMEMNPLLSARQQQQKAKTRAMEIPLGSIRFIQELGEGAFGKVYKGELSGFVGGHTTLVAIKTLKPGANTKTKSDFARESELMTDMRHPNIVCLIGVCMQVEMSQLSSSIMHFFSPKIFRLRDLRTPNFCVSVCLCVCLYVTKDLKS